MSWFESVSFKNPVLDAAKPLDAAAMVQLGAMSPLWMMLVGASTAGMAYWGMTRWMGLATPAKIAENVVKLRLVAREVAAAVPEVPIPLAIEPVSIPEVIAELKALAPAPTPVKPVVAEVASVSVVMPEPVAKAAAAAAPELVKIAPKAKAVAIAKPKPVVVVAKPAVNKPAKKVVAKAPVKAKSVPTPAPVKAVAKAVDKAAPVKAAAPKPAAKRTVKAKAKT
jgi:hypothetical protein